MSTVGQLREIWRYPVKSMQGDTVTASRVSAAGLRGDRAWAMRDEVRREVQWGKRYPVLMQCRARYVEEPDDGPVKPVAVTFPDGETVRSDDDRVHAKLTALIGQAARLWPLQPAADRDFYKRYKPDEAQFMQEAAGWFAREPGEPLPDFSQFPEVLMDYVAVPGTFFDNEEIHLVTSASLAHLRGLNPAADWDIRRFRPNFFIETPAELVGLVENDWVGKRLRIGEVELEVSAPTPRCGMTVQPQGALPYDKTVLRTIVKEAAQCLGVGAHCRVAGSVRAGDAVELLD
jgi:uncharacterized protein